jgi:nuclear protein localization family protein 4
MVSFMNQEELQIFVSQWTKNYCIKQKMGYMYGYYATDPNYPDGVRAVCEMIYEPPQEGDTNSVEPMKDPDQTNVDKIIKALNFELLGMYAWLTYITFRIVTSINTNKEIPLTSYDVRKMARYQQEHIRKHYTNYDIPNFVTAIVRPLENMETEIECYMVSDMCMALERDGVFTDSDDRKLMKIREPKNNEVVPTVLMEDKQVKTVDPVFFIVNVRNSIVILGEPRCA